MGLTTIPTVIGMRIGMRCGNELCGAGVGVVLGFVLAVRCVIVPLWKEAGEDNGDRRENDE